MPDWRDEVLKRLPGYTPPPAPVAPVAPPPASGLGPDGLPTHLLPSVPDFAEGTPVPGTGGSPTQAPVQRRGVDLPPHETPANRLQELENYEWQAKRLFDQALTDLAKVNPEDNADAYQRLRTAATSAQSAYQAAQNAVTAETTRAGQTKKPHTVTKQERGPDGETYVVTYDVDAAGNEQWNGQKPVKLDLGTSPTAGIDLQTAQLNLQRAQQQLAAENDPLKKAQLQLAVDQARFTLTQAQARGPLDLNTAQLQYLTAKEAHDQATSPEAKAQKLLELQTAQVALDVAKQGLARGNAPQVIPSDSTSPTITTRDPTTGAVSTQPNPAYQGPTFADATAAYNAQVPRLQQAARTERDRLLELQRSGAISEADAERQFSTWFGTNVEAPLAGYRTAAEEAQRKEQRENATLQRAEDARAEGLNRARETVGYQAGEQARSEAMRLAPQARTPQFLSQLGSAVAGMSARAGAKSAEEAAKLPAGPRFTAETFDPKNWAGSVPDFDAVARQATERALASISPSVAARIGAPMPQLPTGPTLQSMLGQIPYRGPLSGLPSPASGLLPTPGVNQALDIGGGRARTPYGAGGNVWLDWDIPR